MRDTKTTGRSFGAFLRPLPLFLFILILGSFVNANTYNKVGDAYAFAHSEITIDPFTGKMDYFWSANGSVYSQMDGTKVYYFSYNFKDKNGNTQQVVNSVPQSITCYGSGGYRMCYGAGTDRKSVV
jgi:hypothetical protein